MVNETNMSKRAAEEFILFVNDEQVTDSKSKTSLLTIWGSFWVFLKAA